MVFDTVATASEQAGGTAPSAYPWVESPFFADELSRRRLDPVQRDRAVRYHEDGYLIIPCVADDSLCDRVREETEALFRPPFPPGRSVTRVQDAWTTSFAARQLAAHPKVMETLAMLYGRRPIPFQTLNFPVGTEQRAHSDTIHFSSYPGRYMCGVWVALEDITPESGPLFYYPGSHRLPELDCQDLNLRPGDYPGYEDRIEALVRACDFEQHELVARKGDALVWASNLIHGGNPILRPGSSRWSQVTHFYFEGCIYYTPMLSNTTTGELCLRNALVDIATGLPAVQSYGGSQVLMAPVSDDQFRISVV